MGLNLLHGGHLSHGSSVNRSGKYYKIVHYSVDAHERLDYDDIRKLALENKQDDHRRLFFLFLDPDWKSSVDR
jgi:glycine/serine hydroxymethyltransferase